MRILIVDDRVPDPHFGAGFPRAYRLLMSLIRLGHKINFFPTVKASIQELNLPLLSSYGIDVCENLDQIRDLKIDVAIMSRPHNVHYYMPKIREMFAGIKVIYDTEALWFRRYDLQMSITGRLPGWAYRYDEIGLAQRSDLCFVVNDIEKEILEGNQVKKVVKLGHALDIHRDGMPFEIRSNVLVVGGKLEEDSSNEDGLWEYLDNSWRKVQEFIQCDMDVTGHVLTDRLRNNTFGHINLMGHVDNLVPLYESRKVFVAATRFATGIPWKVHEAMAHGIPCVISRLLGDQLGLTDDSTALICDNYNEFVQKTAHLYTDSSVWNSVRENGFNLIATDCSPTNFMNTIQESLDAIVS